MAARDLLYERLLESGVISREELLLARVETAFNRGALDPSRRASSVDLIERSSEELRGILARRVENGFLAPAKGEEIERALEAVKRGLAWFESPLFSEKAPAPPARDEGPSRGSTDRIGARKAILELRRERLREELPVLDAALDRPLDVEDRARTTALEVRRLILRACLDDLTFEEARKKARDSLVGLEGAVSSDRLGELQSLVALLDWHGPGVMDILYGE